MSGDKPDLIAVFGSYGVEVRDGRVEQLVRCPVHNEDRASCTVNVIKQLWSCKACSAQGDAYSLLMLMEGIDFAAANKLATEKFGVVPSVPAGRSRKGLSGKAGPAGRGYRPAFRRGLSAPR